MLAEVMARLGKSSRIASIVMILCLTACGGGGQDEPTPPPAPPPTPSASAPTITTQPTSLTVASGGAPSFSVVATGNGTLSYSWRFNGTAIAGATASTYALSGGATTANAGSYDCVVTNSLNGTTATATSAAATLSVVTPPTAPALSSETAVQATTAGHVISTAAQTGVTYEWSVTNATITAGQGTPQITYTAGHAGRATAFLTVSNIAGTKVANRTIVIAASVPIDTVFAQDVVHPSSKGVLASAPVIDNGSYAWAVQSMGALPTINGPQNSASLSYDVGSAPGTYRLTVDISDTSGHTAMGSRTVTVARNVFLKDVRDPMPRSLHTATLLNDGRVLVAGGDGGIPDFGTLVPQVGSQSKVLGSAEIFDPATRTFASVGAFTPRMAHTATLLDDGTVLVVGGTNTSTNALAVAETYDPAARSWTPAAQPAGVRAFHTATVLADGRVLVVGGFDGSAALTTAEIYNPGDNSWTAAASMSVARALHSAVRLGNGKVLVAGGRNGPGNLASSELYDPASNTWTPAASMSGGRSAVGLVLLPGGKALILGAASLIYDPQSDKWEESAVVTPPSSAPTGIGGTTAILLPDGRVLAIGGFSHFNASRVGIYDPIARMWTELPGHEGSYGTATALRDGRVLEIGGISRGSDYDVASDFQSYGGGAIFDPVVPASVALGSSAHSGADAQATVLADGRVLVSGGNVSRISTAQKATAVADIFNPSTNQWSATAPMSTARAAHRAVVLGDGRVLVTGGNAAFIGAFATTEIFDPQTQAWASAGAMNSARFQHTATVLIDGRVLVVGGNSSLGPCSCTTFERTVDIYDPTAKTWSPTGPLLTARYDHTATRLLNGKILVTGGFGGVQDSLHAGGSALSSAELYDPTLGTWAAVPSMSVARRSHTAELLDSGLVLVTGGTDGNSTLASAELYDPVSNTWSAAPSMGTPRQSHSSVRMADGTVVVFGGFNSSSSAAFGIQSAEVYDSAMNQWTSAGSLVVARQKFASARLQDGRVLIVGGDPVYSGVPEFYQ